MNDYRPANPPYGATFRQAAQEDYRRRNGSASALPHALAMPANGPTPWVSKPIEIVPPCDVLATVELIRAASVTMTAVRWLWNGYFARGKFHVLGGAPGCGKTTIVLALAAAITSRGRFPDGSPCGLPGNVVIWSGEDDPGDTLAPRLAAAGADMNRVFFVGSVKEGGKARAFDPSKDTGPLRDAIKAAGGAALLMVDPIVSAVAGDSHKNAEVRRALQPLADLAAEADAALIGITHFSKGTSGRDPTERITGSLAFGALARVVMIAAKVEPKDDEPAKRIFARSKSNIGADDGGFEYELEQVEVPGHAGLFASVVRWGASIDGSARDILAEAETVKGSDGSAIGDAKAFLRDLLLAGPMPVKGIRAAAHIAGVSDITLRRAREAMGVVLSKAGMEGGWQWSLPEGDHQSTKMLSLRGVNTFGKNDHLRDDDGGVDV